METGFEIDGGSRQVLQKDKLRKTHHAVLFFLSQLDVYQTPVSIGAFLKSKGMSEKNCIRLCMTLEAFGLVEALKGGGFRSGFKITALGKYLSSQRK